MPSRWLNWRVSVSLVGAVGRSGGPSLIVCLAYPKGNWARCLVHQPATPDPGTTTAQSWQGACDAVRGRLRDQRTPAIGGPAVQARGELAPAAGMCRGPVKPGMGGSGGSSGDHADAVSPTDLVPFVIGGRAVDRGEVVLDAAGRDDQQQPRGPSRCPEPVRAPAGQEDETACPGVEEFAAAVDRQLAVQDVEALVFAVMDMQWRPGLDAGLKDAQYSAGRPARRLEPWIARQPGARGSA